MIISPFYFAINLFFSFPLLVCNVVDAGIILVHPPILRSPACLTSAYKSQGNRHRPTLQQNNHGQYSKGNKTYVLLSVTCVFLQNLNCVFHCNLNVKKLENIALMFFHFESIWQIPSCIPFVVTERCYY